LRLPRRESSDIEMHGFRFRRRRFIVPGFQSRFIATQLVWWAVGLFVFAAALLIPAAAALQVSEPDRRQHAAETFLLLHQYLWPALALLFTVATAVTVHMSHRIAGPLYRLRRVCEQVGSGDLTVHARVRQGDYLVEEAAAFEAMLVSLRARIGRTRDALAEVADYAHLAETDPLGTALRMQQTCRLVDRACNSLRDFQLPADVTSGSPDAQAAASAHVQVFRSRSRHEGFSVVEILIAALIIGILASICTPRYLAALEAARLTKAVGDIKAIEKDVQIYFVLHSCFPGTLTDIGQDKIIDPWGHAYVYNVLAPKRGTCPACNAICASAGQARKDRSLVPINSDFDLFSMGKDGTSVGPLTAAVSQDDIVRGSDGGFVGLAADY